MNNTHWTDAQRARLIACIDAGDRISFWCSDAFGRPANGGGLDIERAAPGVIHRSTGRSLCAAGALHYTDEPHRWVGVRVWVVACRDVIGEQHDKGVCREREVLGEILPEEAIVASVACRLAARLTSLAGADLSYADLSCADLSCADLCGADLSCADLRAADLRAADLYGVNLRGADLSCADLSGADLSCADLSGADLSCADLSGADMLGVDLICASLAGAYRPEGGIPGWAPDAGGCLRRAP